MSAETAHPPEGAEILDALRTALLRYVVLPGAEYADAIVLWVAATHAQPAWDHAPRLVIKAPEKRCGKSRLLDIIEATCHKPLITVNASPSAVYRSITDDPPTILMDEADTIFGTKITESNEAIRGLLNAGHQRNRPTTRYDAASRTVEELQTFAMAALAGIGSMPDTIEDRAVIVRMRRRTTGETVAPYRYRRDRPPLRVITEHLSDWMRGSLEKLEAAEPAMPLEDRAADTWEPLIAVADLAGLEWPDRARHAALTLTEEAASSSEVSNRIRLLTDCRAAFDDLTAMSTAHLLAALKGDAEAPWGEYGPSGLTGKKLADLLREYDIKSTNIRFPDGTQAKGYNRADFTDAWNRYCPTDPEVAGDPSHPSQAHLRRSGMGRIESWDASKRPNLPNIAENEGGTDGTASPNTAAICIVCRHALAFDDGTGTHPNCIDGAA